MMEHKVLSCLLQSRQSWESLRDLIDPLKELSPEGGIIFQVITDYYEADKDAQRCDPEILRQRVAREVQSNKIANLVSNSITNLSSADVSVINVTKEALAIKLGALGIRIAAKLASGKQTTDIKELMNEYVSLEDKIQVDKGSKSEGETFTGVKAADLCKKDFNPEGLIQLYPLVLNRQLDNGLRPGHHVIVFGPVEVGKSLFIFNASYGFLKQGLRVLWVENEDPASDSLMRMMTRLTGLTKYQILEDPDAADKLLSNRNWDKFTLANLSPGSFSKIERIAEEVQPKVIILNQLRNINVSIDQRTQALEKAATEARNLAKRRNVVVVSVTQAADSASGKTVLDRGDIDGSNVGIPGQGDLMIGIGATAEMEEINLRTISLVKNNINGNKTPITVTIDPFTSRILEL